jgi:hypothetical protein
MVRRVEGVNKADGTWSLPRHRVQAPCVCLKFFLACFDSSPFVGSLDSQLTLAATL